MKSYKVGSVKVSSSHQICKDQARTGLIRGVRIRKKSSPLLLYAQNPIVSPEAEATTLAEVMNSTTDKTVFTEVVEPIFRGNIWEEEGVTLAIRNSLVSIFTKNINYRYFQNEIFLVHIGRMGTSFSFDNYHVRRSDSALWSVRFRESSSCKRDASYDGILGIFPTCEI